MPESARDRSFALALWRCASSQVRHAAQAQALGNFSQSLATGCEEAAQEAPVAQFL